MVGATTRERLGRRGHMYVQAPLLHAALRVLNATGRTLQRMGIQSISLDAHTYHGTAPGRGHRLWEQGLPRTLPDPAALSGRASQGPKRSARVFPSDLWPQRGRDCPSSRLPESIAR